jgi:HK97 family phage prohead protease
LADANNARHSINGVPRVFYFPKMGKQNGLIEKRTLGGRELWAAGDAAPTLAGYAAVFNQPSENLGGDLFQLYEQIAPGAFAETIQQDDVRALFNHNSDFVLGRKQAGTLTLREDGVGLYIEVVPPDTQWARDLTTTIARGDITQMSFAFTVLEEEFRYDREKDIVYRTLNKVRLYEVSPVTFPAYPQTSVGVREQGLAEVVARADAFRKQQRDSGVIPNAGALAAAQESRERLKLRARIAAI